MKNIGYVVLWSLVIVSGILVGGSVFERVVLTPLWAGAPPASVMAWPYGTIQRPFFETVTPIWALLALATFVLSFAMPAQARPWARVAGVIGVAVMIWTVAFFIPLLMKTEANRGAGLSGEDITRYTLQFVNWGLLRTAIALAGWLAALRALVLVSRQSA
jgi:hypothetical protein